MTLMGEENVQGKGRGVVVESERCSTFKHVDGRVRLAECMTDFQFLGLFSSEYLNQTLNTNHIIRKIQQCRNNL